MKVREPFLGARGGKNEMKIRQQNENRLIDTGNELVIARQDRGLGAGWKNEGIKKYALVITKEPWGWDV